MTERKGWRDRDGYNGSKMVYRSEDSQYTIEKRGSKGLMLVSC